MDRDCSSPATITRSGFIEWIGRNQREGMRLVGRRKTPAAPSFIPDGSLATFWAQDRLCPLLADYEIPLAVDTVQENLLRTLSTLLHISDDTCSHVKLLYHLYLKNNVSDAVLPLGRDAARGCFQDLATADRFYDAQFLFCPTNITAPSAWKAALLPEAIVPLKFDKILQEGDNSSAPRVGKYEVYEGSQLTGKFYAVKDFPPPEIGYTYRSEVDTYEELRSWDSRDHPEKYFLDCKGAFEQDGRAAIVLEFAEGGSLRELLDKNRTPFTRRGIIEFWSGFVDLYRALHCLHSMGMHTGPDPSAVYIHQDITPANIFIVPYGQDPARDGRYGTRRLRFKLGDFGYSSKVKRRIYPGVLHSQATKVYGAPELFPHDAELRDVGGEATRETDMWSLGCVTMEVAVWLVGGIQAKSAFFEARKQENKLNNRHVCDAGHDAAFHNGIDRLQAVNDARKFVEENRRASDGLSIKIVDHVLKEVLRESDRQPADTTAGRLQRIINDYKEPEPALGHIFKISPATPPPTPSGRFASNGSPVTPPHGQSPAPYSFSRYPGQLDAGPHFGVDHSLATFTHAASAPSPTTSSTLLSPWTYQPSHQDHGFGSAGAHNTPHHLARATSDSQVSGPALWVGDGGRNSLEDINHPWTHHSPPAPGLGLSAALSHNTNTTPPRRRDPPKHPKATVAYVCNYRKHGKHSHPADPENIMPPFLGEMDSVLHGRDQVFLVDDCHSMISYAEDVRKTLEAIITAVKRSDKDGMEIRFVSAPGVKHILAHAGEVKQLLKDNAARATDIGERGMARAVSAVLDDVLLKAGRAQASGAKHPSQASSSPWRGRRTSWFGGGSPRSSSTSLSPPSGTNVYVLSDGNWGVDRHRPEDPTLGVADRIRDFIRKQQDEGRAHSHTVIQLVSFGDDDVGLQRLRILDDELWRDAVRDPGDADLRWDIVDTKPHTDPMWCILVGALNKSLDGRPPSADPPDDASHCGGSRRRSGSGPWSPQAPPTAPIAIPR